AAAQVDAETGRLEPSVGQAGIGDGLLGRPHGEPRVPAAMTPLLRVFADRRDVEIADFRRDPRGKIAGVEERRRTDARVALQQPAPDRLHVIAQGGDAAYARNYHASSHVDCRLCRASGGVASVLQRTL